MSSKPKCERRTFEEDFNRDAVKLIVEERYSIRLLADLPLKLGQGASWIEPWRPDTAPPEPMEASQ